VTGLGVFRHFGRLFTFGSFLTITERVPIFWSTFSTRKSCCELNLTKTPWAIFSQTHLVTLLKNGSTTDKSEAIALCKEMPVIRVNQVVDKKKKFGKRGFGGGGGEALGVSDSPPPHTHTNNQKWITNSNKKQDQGLHFYHNVASEEDVFSTLFLRGNFEPLG
jgi:hypothetical protein